MKSPINKRLAKILLIDNGLTCYEVGKRLNTSTQKVDTWLKGSNGKFASPSTDALAEICKEFNINSEYLLTGKGNIYRNDKLK